MSETVIDAGTDRMIARKAGAIGWLIFNNPARHNAVSMAMWQAIPRAAAAFAADPEIRVVVVTGAGERAFVAGADISEFETLRATPAQIAAYDRLSEDACRTLEELSKPTIAMIRGYCIGGGLDIALRCDLRLAAEDARFGIPAARLGVGYTFPEIARLVALVGPALAKDILFSGRQLSAAEALRGGLVNGVVPAASLAGTVADYAATIAANAPLTIAAAKRCVAEAVKDAGQRDLEACDALVKACFASADYAEGRRAFMEKRRPRFQGR
ncbi:MAG TPA: enoyl-CoA hydratase [Alphaproteobacteria bacterium]|nr:enoyl-CoA hydratase [Alphaproteobacteria bacterium]